MSALVKVHRPAWVEGMPLLVQHFQQLDRSLDGQSEFEARRTPLGHGILSLEIQDELVRNQLTVTVCEAVFEDGASVDIPGQDAPVSIGGLDQRIPVGTKRASLYLVLPRHRGGSVSAESRYRRGSLDSIPDEFGEARPEPLEILEKNIRLEVLAEDSAQLPTDIVALKLAEIERDGQHLRLVRDRYIPACLTFDASPLLRSMVETVLRRAGDRVKALNATAGVVVRDGSRHYDNQIFGDFWTLQALAPQVRVLAQMLEMRGVHPIELFRELLRLVTALALLRENDLKCADEIYRHHDLFGCFKGLCDSLGRLLQDVSIDQYQWAQRIAHEGDMALWLFTFKDLAFLNESAVYLGLKSSLPPAVLAQHLRRQLPTVRESNIAMTIYTQGEDGIPLLPIANGQLPRQGWVEANAVYCKLRTDTAHGRQVWELIRRTGELSIYVPDIKTLGQLSMMVVAVHQSGVTVLPGTGAQP